MGLCESGQSIQSLIPGGKRPGKNSNAAPLSKREGTLHGKALPKSVLGARQMAIT